MDVLTMVRLHNDTLSILFFCLIQTIMIVTIVYTLHLFRKKNAELYTTQMELENLKRNVNGLEALRKMRHDIGGHIHVLQFLCKHKKYDRLDKYIDQLSDSITPSDITYSTKDPALNVILGDMELLAKQNNVEYDVALMMENFYINSTDLCSLVMNVIKNAIEATLKLDVQYRKVSFEAKCIPGGFNIRCENTATRGISEKSFNRTSKKDKINHGYGVKIIKSVTRKYKAKTYIYAEKDCNEYDMVTCICSFNIKEIAERQNKSESEECTYEW